MVTDRDFCKSVLAGALDDFGVEPLAAILNVSAVDLRNWAQGRARPPAEVVLQVIDLMWPRSAPESS